MQCKKSSAKVGLDEQGLSENSSGGEGREKGLSQYSYSTGEEDARTFGREPCDCSRNQSSLVPSSSYKD
jgi:hypothetical protein